MGLFHLGKKKEEKEIICACNTQVEAQEESCCDKINSDKKDCCCSCENVRDSIQSIKILGAGCKSCHMQYENAKEAVKNLDISVEVEYITDMEKIMAYGVMSMPAIVVNEKVVSMGKVLKTAEVEKLFERRTSNSPSSNA